MIAAALIRGAVSLVAAPVVVNNVVTDGDSIIATVFGGGTSVNDKIDGILRASDVTGFGVAGQTLEAMNTDAATEIDPTYSAAHARNVCVVWAGTNDLYFGASAATTISRLETYCNARKAAGWQVVVCTVLPRSNSGTPGTFEADRTTVNTSIRANWATYADALCDVAADSRIGDAGDETNTTYYFDLVHLTDLGRQEAAFLILNALATLGVS